MNNALTVTLSVACCGLRAASPQAAFSPLKTLNWYREIWTHSQDPEVIQLQKQQPYNSSIRLYVRKDKLSPLSDLGKAAFSTTALRFKKETPKPSTRTHSQNNVANHRSNRLDHQYSKYAGLSKTASSGRSQQSDLDYEKYPELRFKTLSQGHVKRIFGPTISEKLGNGVLRKLQSQRATGTLDDNSRSPKIDPHLEAEGLMWLRSKYPFDEDAAIMKRIELEELQTDAELIASAERTGLYTPINKIPNSQSAQSPGGVYGHSVLDEIRAHNKELDAKMQEAKEAKEAEDQAEEIRNASKDSQALQTPAGRAVLARRTESAEWVKRYKEAAVVSHTPPEKMHPVARLWPSGLFTLIVIGASILFAQNYVPPPQQARIYPDIPPAASTVQALIFLNVVAFMCWRIPPLWRFMNRYCIMVTGFPKWQSILGNVFSHQQVAHLGVNMVGLWFIGTQLHDDIGRGKFLAVYISCGVFASFSSLSIFVLSNNLGTASLGASGAITGLIAALCMLHAGESFKIPLFPSEIIPHIPAIGFLIALIGFEIVSIVGGLGKGYRVDRWAHMGGYISGIPCGYILKRRQQQRNAETQKKRNPSTIEKAMGYGARPGGK